MIFIIAIYCFKHKCLQHKFDWIVKQNANVQNKVATHTHSTDADALFPSPPSNAQQLTSVQRVRKLRSDDVYNLNHMFIFMQST